MKKSKLEKEDYIFKNIKGKLKFIGDFERLYSKENDPWGQGGSDLKLKKYYIFSRSKLIKTIKPTIKDFKKRSINILEVGCGLGYMTAELQKGFSEKVNMTGMDISSIAIRKARSTFPFLKFLVGDICSDHLKIKKQYDVVIMSHILWYILERLPQVFINIDHLLKENGILIFVNAFIKLDKQKYGRDIIEGFDGLVKYIYLNYFQKYKIIKAEVDYSGRSLYDNRVYDSDGILVLKKVS